MQCHLSSKRMNVILITLVALALGALISTPVYGQVTGATLSGTVTDTSGAAIVEAQIIISNISTGVDRTAVSDSAGFYSSPNLLPGAYRIVTSAQGFTTQVRNGITLEVGAEQVLNFTMQVGQTTERVEVTGAAPTVQLASSSIGGLVESQTVVDLPLNGRDWTTLAALQPGVNQLVTQAGGAANANRSVRGFGTQLSISGTRPQLNNYRVDGVSVVDYSGGSPGSVLGISLGVDAIAEFSVLTSNQSAEYGRTSGGVVNAITRSGTNQYHGDVYWFLRDEDFDARNFFDASTVPFHRNQFGGSVGGPIQKDKTFFFADYEGLRSSTGVTNVNKVPSQDARNGILHNSDGSITTIAVDPQVQPFLPLYPLPNDGLLGTGNTGLYRVAVSNIDTENFVTARVDRKFGEKDSLSGTYFYDHGLTLNPDAFDNVVDGSRSVRQMVALEETHVFSPSLVNSLRFGFSRVATLTNFPAQAANPLSLDQSLAVFPGHFAPILKVTGLTTNNGGEGSLSIPLRNWNSYQAYDDAFFSKGNHSLKFGFAFERMQFNFLTLAFSNGQVTFGSLPNFLTNAPGTFTGALASDSNIVGTRQSLFGGYVQDDWRLRSNLTVNLGLRYEMSTVPTEPNNRLSNLPTYTSTVPKLGSPYFNNPTLRNFEPRVGFSWDPFRNGKTAVRGAFGMFDILPLALNFFKILDEVVPFNVNLVASNLAPGSFPSGLGDTGLMIPQNEEYGSVQTNPPRNYLMMWNLNVQRELNASTSLMVGYIGNHGVHMVNRTDDANDVLPMVTPQGLLWPSPAGSGTPINPSIGDLRIVYWGGDAEYDALQVQVTKKMSHGFQAQGSYTFAKGIDTGSASVVGDPFTNSISSLFWFCRSCRRGLSDYNIAHTLTINYLWNLPSPKNWGTFASHTLGGWTAGGIITAETGVPFTPLIGGDPLGLNSSDPFAFPNRVAGPGCGSAVNPGNPDNYIKLNCFAAPNPLTLLGNSGRNSLIGPGLVDFDLSLFKNNYIRRISETFNVQLRAEFFNIFNRPNFAVPVDNSALFDQSGSPVGGAGAIDATSTTSRQIQFAVKLIW
jgi:hypothetical protein